ncbi:Putative flippase GtrA (transmembrane translocase of bactoprenol-linked glucose) [Nakamurella panacisegetis]|uniref:Putative flippase GtrA (Transmembrane translocase of bactoprenol-linked glucose) n=1 Tax=Nakamurella panacisegetis TaxID=1090615 RepID=A0A1H0PJ81_9ACTN|nr:GtrA family protein [Nakamurella panacisegetis]SDP04705.1 Putative flippase GtrA (transmembrane translocase of bactoprenol-linked glucose) [Nakamurella panacisegetis]
MTTGNPGPDGDDAPTVPEQGLLLRLVHDQRLAFAVVGGLNTVIGFVAFALFSRWTSAWGGDVAVLLAQAVAIPIGFTMHRRFVFKVTGHVARDLGRFVMVNLIPITVNLVVLPVLTKGFGWPVLWSQVGFTLSWVVSSFFLHRSFSFHRSEADQLAAGAHPKPPRRAT